MHSAAAIAQGPSPSPGAIVHGPAGSGMPAIQTAFSAWLSSSKPVRRFQATGCAPSSPTPAHQRQRVSRSGLPWLQS